MRTASSTGDIRFDKFWTAYPRHVSKDKAQRAFERLHPTDDLLQQMLEAIEQQRKFYGWSKETMKFVPHPATWLNQKRWEDDTSATGNDIPDDSDIGAFVY